MNVNRNLLLLILLIAPFFGLIAQNDGVSIFANQPNCGKNDGYVLVTPPPHVQVSSIKINGVEGDLLTGLGPGNVSVTIELENYDCQLNKNVELKGSKNYIIGISKSLEFNGCGQFPDLTITCEGEQYTSDEPTEINCGSITCSSELCPYYFSYEDDCENETILEGVALNILSVCSADPNEVIGPNGNGTPKWLNPQSELTYLVLFENDPVFASAPAKRVQIRVPLSEYLDPSSIRFLDYNFSNQNNLIPGAPPIYQGTLDRTQDLGILVDVLAGWNVVTNELVFDLIAKDPTTGLPPSDPFTGLLPVNDSTAVGEGGFNFNIGLKENFVQTGDSVLVQADIVFDANESILTNIWRNVIDAIAPESFVESISFDQTELIATLNFSAADDLSGSGVSKLNVYSSINDSEEFNLIAEEFNPNETYSFEYLPETSYKFYTLATDTAGNVQLEPINILEITTPLTSDCIADYNNDLYRGIADLTFFLAGFGCSPPQECFADLNNDGYTTANDLSIFLSVFGTECD